MRACSPPPCPGREITELQRLGAAVFAACLENVIVLPTSHRQRGDPVLSALCDAAWTGEFAAEQIVLMLSHNEDVMRQSDPAKAARHTASVISTTVAGASMARRSAAEARSLSQRDPQAAGADPRGGAAVFAFDALHLDGSGDDPCQPDSRGAEAYRGLPARGLVQAGAPGLLGANVCALLKLNNGVPLTFPVDRSFVLYETEAELVAGNPPAVIVGVNHTVRGSPQSTMFCQTSLALCYSTRSAGSRGTGGSPGTREYHPPRRGCRFCCCCCCCFPRWPPIRCRVTMPHVCCCPGHRQGRPSS